MTYTQVVHGVPTIVEADVEVGQAHPKPIDTCRLNICPHRPGRCLLRLETGSAAKQHKQVGLLGGWRCAAICNHYGGGSKKADNSACGEIGSDRISQIAVCEAGRGK
jgi:hypothetical protein